MSVSVSKSICIICFQSPHISDIGYSSLSDLRGLSCQGDHCTECFLCVWHWDKVAILQKLTHLILSTTHGGCYSYPHHSQMRKQKYRVVTKLPKVTEHISDRAGIQTWTGWPKLTVLATKLCCSPCAYFSNIRHNHKAALFLAIFLLI